MRIASFIILFLLLLAGCIPDSTRVRNNDIPPDEWPGKLNKLSKPSMISKNNRLYAGTINMGNSTSEHFYCFDLLNGKVLWEHEVSGYATFHPIVLDDVIYFVTYTGERYAFDTTGRLRWYKNFQNSKVSFSFKERTFNPVNHNLILSDVIGGFYEFDKHTGEKLSYTAPCDSCTTEMTLPVFIGNIVYFANTCDPRYNKPENNIPFNSLVCMDYTTRKIKWSVPVKYIERLHVHKGNIFGFGPNNLYAVNGSTGAVLWQVGTEPATSFRPHFLEEGILHRSGGQLLLTDYASGRSRPFSPRADIKQYTFCDSTNKCYTVNVSHGSFSSNSDFDDAWDVSVEKKSNYETLSGK